MDKEASTSERKMILLPENPTTLNKKIYPNCVCLNLCSRELAELTTNLLLDLLKLKCYCKRKCILYSITSGLAG